MKGLDIDIVRWSTHTPVISVPPLFVLPSLAADVAGLSMCCVDGLLDRQGLRLVLAHEVSAVAL